ncbi:hypothetical protein PG990_012409 [Apiospora arundinis]
MASNNGPPADACRCSARQSELQTDQTFLTWVLTWADLRQANERAGGLHDDGFGTVWFRGDLEETALVVGNV